MTKWPSTPEKVALGKALYHEKNLASGTLSCASCHDVATYGVDNKPNSPGPDGKSGERNTPTTLNAFRQFAQFWDGRAATVEEQSTMHMVHAALTGNTQESNRLQHIGHMPHDAAFAAHVHLVGGEQDFERAQRMGDQEKQGTKDKGQL